MSASRDHFRKYPVKFVSFKDFRFQDIKDFSNDLRDFKLVADPSDTGSHCSINTQFFDNRASTYCNLCVYLEFISYIGSLSTMLWAVCVCFHFFILVSYRSTKLASRLTYAYYVIAWLVPLGISLWLLFHNWFGFEPTYSTVNCGIKTGCVPHHHPYHYDQNRYGKHNWNQLIGLLFGFKIWQVLVFLIIPCLFVAIRCKNRKHVSYIYIINYIIIMHANMILQNSIEISYRLLEILKSEIFKIGQYFSGY